MECCFFRDFRTSNYEININCYQQVHSTIKFTYNRYRRRWRKKSGGNQSLLVVHR